MTSPVPEFDVYQTALIGLWLVTLIGIVCYSLDMLYTLLVILIIVVLVLLVLGLR